MEIRIASKKEPIPRNDKQEPDGITYGNIEGLIKGH
jgi:hypothetical protein